MPNILLFLILLIRLATAGTLSVEVLDVGQGDSILIRSPAGKTVLIDAGIARADVVGMLRQRGIQSIDLAIATHAHADHIGGMAAVLEAFPVSFFADSGVAHTTATYDHVMQAVEQKDIPYRAVRVGQSFSLDDGIVLQVLSPQEPPLRGTRSDLNSNSVVIRMTHGHNCFLFTGDSEEPTERALLANELEPCDVLKVAHHGGRYSSTPAFLAALQPSIAVISVGTRNRYGHPTAEALGRLQAAGATIYRTDLQGTIKLLSDKRNITVSTSPEASGALVGVTDRAHLPQPLQAKAPAPARPPSEHTTPPPVSATAPAASTTVSAEAPVRRRRCRLFRRRARPATSPPPSPDVQRAAQPSPSAAPPADDRINLNATTISELDALPGIGPAKAAAILGWLSANAPCTDVEQLDAVSGVGPATIEHIRGLVTCGPMPDASPPAAP